MGIVHPLEDTPHGRSGGDGTELPRVVPQDRQVTGRVGAVADGDGGVGENRTGKMDRQCLVPTEEDRAEDTPRPATKLESGRSDQMDDRTCSCPYPPGDSKSNPRQANFAMW